MDDDSSFGALLRHRRTVARLTQEELAHRAGVSVRAVRSIERGVTRPRWTSVRRLAEATGIAVEDAWAAVHRDGELSLRVLGRLELRLGSRAVDLGPHKQRCLLALLALRANLVVPRGEIVDALWGASPPDSCHGLVHTYVSRLRKVVGPAVPITAERGGYLLAATSDRLDLLGFEDLLVRADRAMPRDPAAAVTALEQALRLWRGAPVCDLPVLRQHPAVTGLAARRLVAALAYADAAEHRARPEAVVEVLREVAAEEQLHEGLHARLMLALAAAGRQAEALRLFAEVRTRLVKELGVEPGPEVRAAHLRLVRGERPIVAERSVPAQLPTDVSGFAGRAEHLAHLDAHLGALLTDAAAAPVVISAISGTAGVGKTTLAVHWAHRVRDRFPDGQLYVNLRGYAATGPVAPVEALGRLLRALGVAAEHVPADLEEAEGLYRTLLADRRVLVLLDNAAGAEQVRRLLPGSPGCLALVTSRDRLTGLVAGEGARHLAVDVLSPGEARALLAGLLGHERVSAEVAAVDELAAACAYLPLALRIAAANLSTASALDIAAYTRALRAHGRLDELAIDGDERAAVRVAFDLSYARLDELPRRLFRLLGLVPGADFTEPAATALLGAPARRPLAALVAASLLQEQTTGRYQFHDLLREYARDRAAGEETPAERRAALARYHDYYLGTAATAGRLIYPEVTPSVPPSGEALADDRAAVGWLDAELANLVEIATSGESDHVWRLAAVLRGYFVRRGHGREGRVIGLAALAAATRAGDRQAQAAVHDVLGVVHYNLSRYGEAVHHHEQALLLNEEIGDLGGQETSLHSLGRVYSQLGRPARAAGYHERALEISRRIGSPRGEAMALNYVGVTALSLGQLDRAATRTAQALSLSLRIGDADAEVRSMHAAGATSWARGDLLEARALHTRCLRRCRELGWRHGEIAATVSLAETNCDAGAYEQAREQAELTIRQSRELGERRHEAGGLEIMASVSLRCGELDAALAYYAEALAAARAISFGYGETSVLIGLAAARRRTGSPADAVVASRQALRVMEESGMRLLEGRAHIELARGTLALGHAAEALGQVEHALALVRGRGQRLDEARALHVVGLVRAELGDREAAAVAWRAALRLFEEIGTPEREVVGALLGGRG
ncbi:tetratricopeptide repeat protein [Actinophytocola xanthii]|uniref:Transcriptional regulator n=1 Tax=Actinophytocola xanthii TaxID=1912961 RepID=A0A1Q8CT22_9PSEU|nr:tetratricopeptide repeat protein [Actinophytocola xanthii]OLF17484.1 hypothetical protein BU204_11115 [Actinophytocola xanthii]